MDLPAHQLTMTILMTPDTANFAGNVHGGTILKLLDQAAYACADCEKRTGRSDWGACASQRVVNDDEAAGCRY